MRSYCLALFAVELATFRWTTVGHEDGDGRIYALDTSFDAIVIARRNFLELYGLILDGAGAPTKKLIRRVEWSEGAVIASGTALLDFKLVNSTLLYFCSTLACA